MSAQQLTDRVMDQWLCRESRAPFSYPEVGATAGELPRGYDHDCQRVLLGVGDAVFVAAREALAGWRQFPPSWTAIYPREAPLKAGTTVLMLCRVLFRRWVNGCRVVDAIDEAGPPHRFGFAYGTLPSHVERGEERFLIEMDRAGNVWYEIRAFSKPRHWLLWLGYPLVRRYQAKFRRESASTLQGVVRAALQRREKAAGP